MKPTPHGLGRILLLGMLGTQAVLLAQNPPSPAPANSTQPAAAQATPPPGAPAVAGAPATPPPAERERKILARFDLNGDGRLEGAERAAARAWLRANPLPNPFNRPAPGAPGAAPGGAPSPTPAGAPPALPPGAPVAGPAGGPPPGGFVAPRFEPATPGEKITPAEVKIYGKEPLYDAHTLRTLFLTFESADWEKELEDFRRTDYEVPATLLVDGQTFRDVGVHFRGASSYMMVPTGNKRSLNLTLDNVHKDQKFHGVRTLNLLNANGDDSFLRSVLFSVVALNYLPTPRVNLMRVVINGENWGIYSNAEQFNQEFTKHHFGTTKGARWKVPGSPRGRGNFTYLGDDPEPYRRIYELKTKDDPKSWDRLIKLTKTLRDTPTDQLEAALAPLIDIDGALRFLALDVVFVNGDGFWTRTSDYSIFEDPKGRLHILPHDMNETFGFGGGPAPGGPGGPGGRGGPGGPGGAAGAVATAAGGPGAAGAPAVAPRPEGVAGTPPAAGAPAGPGRGANDGRGPRGNGTKTDPLINATNENSPLVSKLLAVPALRAKYLGYVRDIAENWLDWKRLGPIAQRYHELIDADIKRDTRKLSSYAAFVTSLEGSPRSLKAFADERREYLLGLPAIKELKTSAP